MEALIAVLTAIALLFGGGHDHTRNKTLASRTPVKTEVTPGTTVAPTTSAAKPTEIPTPALLPGLIVLGVAAIRKKPTEQVD